jgi:hypothetical protein
LEKDTVGVIPATLKTLKDQGFNNIKTAEDQAQQIYHIADLRRISSYKIICLDATATEEFQDQIYVAIEDNTNSLLEIAKVSSSPRIIENAEMHKIITSLFPQASFKIVPGYFWEPCIELTSRLSVARKFTIDSKEMFLLPDGHALDQLHINQSTL